MYTNYQQVMHTLRSHLPVPAAVAAAGDPQTLKAIQEAAEAGLISSILVGDREAITAMAERLEMNLAQQRIIHQPDPVQAAHTAARLVGEGQAEVLVKGNVNTSDFMRALLAAEHGLRTGRVVSHLAAYQVPGYPRLLFLTDGGINIAPSLDTKVEILHNAVEFLSALGIGQPAVAVLSANEQVNPKMPVTVEARQLAEMGAAGVFGTALVEGPMPLDIAVSAKAARIKGIDSRVAGRADLLLVPDIESGNILGKSIMYFAGGVMAGVVLGARVPVVLNSRADTAQGKLASIALACLARRLQTK